MKVLVLMGSPRKNGNTAALNRPKLYGQYKKAPM